MTMLLLSMLACGPKVDPEALAAAEAAQAEARSAAHLEAVLGDWGGTLSLPGAQLRLVLHLTQTEDGPTATLDSPDQGASGIEASGARVDPDGLVVVEVASIGAAFEGRLDENDQLVGTFSQGQAQLPLTLERNPEPVKRPQEPKPPFPYLEEEVTVEVGEHQLAGTLTLPTDGGPFPAAVLITGSGPQDRDEAIAGHRPFAVLADHLTRSGIAVLRTDDRGVGASTGDFASATTEDFAVDTVAAARWLAGREDIASVGLIGHSEGAMVAPMAAGEAGAAWVVLLAGPAVPIPELMVAQGHAVAVSMGLTDEAVLEGQDKARAALFAAINSEDMDAARTAMVQLTGGGASDEEVEAQLAQLQTPWWQGFLAYDPAAYLQALEVPALALFGGLDVQVSAEQNAEPMRQYLEDGGQVVVLDGLNHLFQPATTGSPMEYAQIETTIAPEALDAVEAFIAEQVAP